MAVPFCRLSFSGFYMLEKDAGKKRVGKQAGYPP
jgi:hypothetical protein